MSGLQQSPEIVGAEPHSKFERFATGAISCGFKSGGAIQALWINTSVHPAWQQTDEMHV